MRTSPTSLVAVTLLAWVGADPGDNAKPLDLTPWSGWQLVAQVPNIGSLSGNQATFTGLLPAGCFCAR